MVHYMETVSQPIKHIKLKTTSRPIESKTIESPTIAKEVRNCVSNKLI